MKKQLCNDEITRLIQRQNVITFKRKNDQKGSLKSQKQQELQEEIASNPNEDNSFHRTNKRNMPLPEINRQKYIKNSNRKRMALRASDPKPSAVYLQKQVRQRDILMLKNANNHLANENLKLKTKNINLEKQIQRLQKSQQDPQKGWIARQGRHTDPSTLKMLMKSLKKEIEELKKQNAKIKNSIKFTTINELQVQRDSILQQTQRLREMIQQEKNRCSLLKMNQHNTSQLELRQLQDRNAILSRENAELKGRASKGSDDRIKSAYKNQQFQKNISRQLLNARNTLKEKQKEIEYLKNQIKKLDHPSNKHDSSLRVLDAQALHNQSSRQIKSDMAMAKQEKKVGRTGKQKRLMSKSAQKYRTQVVNIQKNEECDNCKKLKQTISKLQTQNETMKQALQKFKSSREAAIEQFGKNPLKPPNEEQISRVKRFLIHRFKAHHLSISQATMHLLNTQNLNQLQNEMSIGQLIQVSMAQPFSVLSDRYIQVFIFQLCYKHEKSSEPVTIKEDRKIKKKQLKQSFSRLIGEYQLLTQNREDQMFIQIAQLVTNYQQHIHKALSQRRNSQNTVSQAQFYAFFKEIQLQPEYIDFMVSQIILQSLDLEHINIYNLFQIFYMPQEQQIVETLPPKATNNKSKFKIIETSVKEVDQQYEQSKSFLDSKKRSLNNQRQSQNHLEQSPVQNEQQNYQEHFQQQKGQNESGVVDKPVKFQIQIQNAQEEYVEDYQN